ncbi:hypothetical protein HK097_000528 [Rhizophlyctis rosea]|uniref:Uncharacterized protein n=1 Tax=Rhizophlyctis rosea TaxID=64517 RepID=A0AAD5X1X7_9FUNG|nr:hypothetical protein HK097_000528 [Rhizophlyctis rosea]
MQMATEAGQVQMIPVTATHTTPIQLVLFFPSIIASRLPRPSELRQKSEPKARPNRTQSQLQNPNLPNHPVVLPRPYMAPQNYWEPEYDDQYEDNRYRLNQRALLAIRDQNASALTALLAEGGDSEGFFSDDWDYMHPTSNPLWIAATYADPKIYNILVTHQMRPDNDNENAWRLHRSDFRT